MHRYNNQDHSMLTGMLAARNILRGQQRYDLWQVNVDAEYSEQGAAITEEELKSLEASQPMVPRRLGVEARKWHKRATTSQMPAMPYAAT